MSLRRPVLSSADRSRSLEAMRRAKNVSVPRTKPSPRFDELPGFLERQTLRAMAEKHGLDDPSFRQHAARAGASSEINGQEVLNFGSYDYLALNADPRPGAAAQAAISHYGVSASAARVIAGDRPVHRELEAALAAHYDVDEALTFVSGHATNISVISTITQKDDLIISDAYIHNSATVGIRLSGASRLSFPHNDLDALERLLEENAGRYRATLVIVEGHYSMDGDVPDLARLIALKRRFGFWLMVDEAHGLGCIGPRGKGVREIANVPGREVDIWMGTLSKTLASTGGYVAGSAALIDILKYEAPGFVYSVALAPALAAAALTSLNILAAEPERVERLQALGQFFLKRAEKLGLDTGTSCGSAIVPIMTGSSPKAVMASKMLLERGINVLPIGFPAVPMNEARLRFFLTSDHEEDQIAWALEQTSEVLAELENSSVDYFFMSAET